MIRRRHLMRISPHRNPKRPSQPKIRKFKVIILVDQQVLGFEVPVEDSVGVAVEEAGGELVGEFLVGVGERVESAISENRKRDETVILTINSDAHR